MWMFVPFGCLFSKMLYLFHLMKFVTLSCHSFARTCLYVGACNVKLQEVWTIRSIINE